MFKFEKKKKEKKEVSISSDVKKANIVCICGAGLGSSMVVEMATGDALVELGISAKLSHDTISAAPSVTADIILTGENFRPQFERFSIDPGKTTIIYLRNLTSKDEIKEKIEPILKEKGFL